MSYPYDTFYPPNYDADLLGDPNFDMMTGRSSAVNRNSFVPNEAENGLGYSGRYSSAPEFQLSGSTWPVPVQGAWIDESSRAFLEDQSYNALLEGTVATGWPHGLEHALPSNLYDPIPGESAPLFEARQPVESVHVQNHSLLACPQSAPSSARQTDWQPNTYTPSDAISPKSLAVPSISVDQPPCVWSAGYLPNGPQYSAAFRPIMRGTAAISGSSAPWSRQGLHELRAHGSDSQIGKPSIPSSRLVPTGGGASRTERKELFRSHVSRVPSPGMPLNPTRHAATRTEFSPYYRVQIYDRPALSRRTKGSHRGAQAGRPNSNTSSPLSFASVSPPLSHAGSPMSITSVESNGSPQASGSALPGPVRTQPTAPQASAAPHLGRTAVAELLTQFFKQPDAVAHRPKYQKADLLCQWVNTIGMVCSNRKWEVPGESLKSLTGRKAMGFCSGDRSTVLRHMALHREEERLQIVYGCVPEDQRTIWDDLAIDAQLQLDSVN